MDQKKIEQVRKDTEEVQKLLLCGSSLADKEYAYETRFRNGTYVKNIWKYIPDKVLRGVTNAFADSDGYWIWLDHEEGGWVAYDGDVDCGMIHEYTIADLKKAIKTIRKAT